ncbi:MAG: ABC transporter ATP-binding protein [Cyanothece sp. SIO1E1]|nr:ABC transporter ATP-binding protein [Cyanothece sp. SIO1E1]
MASVEVVGDYDHRRVALQEVHFAIEHVTRTLSHSQTIMAGKEVSTRAAMGFYFAYITKHRSALVWLLTAYAIKHSIFLSYPIAIKFIIDDFIPAGRIDYIFGSIGIIAILGYGNYVLHRRYTEKITIITKNITRDLRNLLVHKSQVLSMQYHANHESGRFFSKIMVDVERTERFSELFFGPLFGFIYTLIFSVAVLAWANWQILLLYLLCLPGYCLIYRHFRSLFFSLQRDTRLANEDLSQSVSQFIQTAFLARIHGEEAYEKRRIDDKNIDVIERHRQVRKSIAAFVVIIETFSQLFLMLIVAFCALAIINGYMLVGALVLFLQYVSRMTQAINTLVNQFPVITEFREAVYSIQEVLTATDEEHNEYKLKLRRLKGQIEFDRVYFAYNQGSLVLSDLATTIKSGETIGLVGESGSGKTTFVHLALGLLRPQQGHVRIDGYDINQLDMRSVRRLVGVVTQEPILLRASLFDNIAYGQENYQQEEVYAAAKMADADAFIRALPQGYHTIIGERGVTLSGGQKQRMAIARAIFRKPAILILDEATSALDSKSEKEVQRCIDKLLGRQTTLIVAHRFSTIVHVDRILVFHSSSIVEHGNHNELIDRQGIYARLLATQIGIDMAQLDVLKV